MSILIHFFTLALVIPFFGLAASVPPISTNSSTCAYASVNHINTVFGYFTEGNYPGFFRYVVDDVDWDIQGTHPLAGHYMNKTIFAMNTIVRLAKVQDYSAPHSTTLQNIVGGCDEPWSVQELQVIATFKNGLYFDNTYAWVTRWNEQGLIVQVRAYLDSVLVTKAIVENESSTDANFTTIRNTVDSGPGSNGNLVSAILG